MASTRPQNRVMLSDVPPGLTRYWQIGTRSRSSQPASSTGFPPGHVLGGFAGFVHDAGDDFQQPGAAGKLQRADPKLLQQNHLVPFGVIEQNCDRVAAFQTLAGHFRTPAASEQFVSQPVFFHPEKSAVANGFVEDCKLMVHGAFRVD